MAEDDDWLSNLLWTDEAHFTLRGSVNTHNCRIWATENPRTVVETPLHDEKVTVWVGFTTSTVIGPFFFEEMRDSGFVTATVTVFWFKMDAANKAILERTKKTRSVSRSLVTKQINKLESEISNTADKTTVHEIYMQLISKFEELSTLDKEIENLIDIESLEEEIVTREEYRDKFIIWKIRAERYVESVSNTAIQNSVENHPQNITLPLNSTVSSVLSNQPCLPKLTLESFSGKDISSFPSFWVRFKSAVHENSSLNDVDKFSYLKSVVTSDAELAIRGLTLTSENYAKAIKILENRFGRKELIVDFHINRLLNLTPVRKSFDVIALRNLYDHEVESRERTELLVKPHDLELKNKNSYSNTKYFERTSHSYPQSNRRVQGHSRFHPSHKSFSSANELLTAAFSDCLFCFENTHMSDLCENLCVQKKRAKLIQEGRCFICCNTGCYVKKYKKEVCSYCKGRHARAICFKLEKSKQNSHLDLEEKNVDVKTTSSNSVFHNRDGVLLQCVKAEIIGCSSSDKIFCLFDNGSEKSFIKKNVSRSEEESISTELRRFWEIESLGILDKGSVTLGNGDEEILSEFGKSVNFVDGRYRVNLPWKPGMREALQNNKTVALRDFTYPHHAVIRSDKTTSHIRIVFDGSAHEDGQSSLNQSLYTGPNLHPNILELLLCFRKSPVAFTADVKSAFLQIELDFRDRDFTRFFWTDNLNKEPYVLNFTRVLFGLRPSPYLLAATLKHHFKKYREQYPHTFELLNSSIYVDDLICGQNDVPDALRTTLECLQIFSDAGMLLRKWRSNSKQLNLLWQQGVKTESSETSAIDLRPPTKVLGLAWDPENDLIYFDPKDLLKFMSRRGESKRFILSVVGRIFDPIGILGPFVIKLKCLLQELWTLGVEWDSELPPKLRHKWQQWSSEAEGLTEIKIPRFYLDNIDQEIFKCEIHCFSDASKSAYGTILYLRFVTCNNEIETSFICSKGRVAPLKSLTLPRLELTAALLSARLAKQVSSCLKFDANIYYWTDSLISYYWIRGDSSAFKPYIKNRVQEIQLLSDPMQWGHCPGKDNPVDLLSRGTSAVKLAQNELWGHGPPWLKLTPDHWPNRHRDILDSELCSEELEHRSSVHEAVTQQREALVDINRFSSLKKLLKTTAWVFRFVNNARNIYKSMDFYITADEIQNDEYFWLKCVQSEFYSAEILALKQNEQLRSSSEIKSLVPYLDENNLLRLTGRLLEADLCFGEKHPVILPRPCKFTELLVIREHERIGHCGVSATLTQLRKKYWVPKSRQLVKTMIRICLVCKKYSAKPADLLKWSVAPR
ncbi:integrase catalytic domain-containing protein [Trichonephila clavipes]|nr:integrase catalytic domain-containing protein [Trichonephila clavipes]